MKKVLVAEDDRILANTYKLKLTLEEFDVKIASNGQAVLDILATFTPDIIILDLVMPKKDGFTVLEEIKKDPKLKSIPVIVASNLGQHEDLERAKALGAVDYLIKSDMSMSGLVEKIRAHLT